MQGCSHVAQAVQYFTRCALLHRLSTTALGEKKPSVEFVEGPHMPSMLSLETEFETPQSQDPRCLRSRSALRNAFVEALGETGDLSKVTVTCVADRAGLTRRTFYAHYRDISELANAVKRETIDELAELVEQLCSIQLDEVFAAIDRTEPVPGSVEILAAMKARQGYLTAIMGPDGDPSFAQELKSRAHAIAAAHALQGIGALGLTSFFDYYISFAVGAIFAVIERWVAGGMEEPAEALARLLSLLVFVRPGDLYQNSYDIDIQGYGLSIIQSLMEARA